MPAQGALPPVHRAQETQFAARGGERLAPLPVPPRAPVPTAAHGSRLLAGTILRRRPGDQDLQRLLRAVPRLRQNDLRHLRGRASATSLAAASCIQDVCQTQIRQGTELQRTIHTSTIKRNVPVKRKTVGRRDQPANFCPAFSSAQQLAIRYLPIVETSP